MHNNILLVDFIPSSSRAAWVWRPETGGIVVDVEHVIGRSYLDVAQPQGRSDGTGPSLSVACSAHRDAGRTEGASFVFFYPVNFLRWRCVGDSTENIQSPCDIHFETGILFLTRVSPRVFNGPRPRHVETQI